MPKNFVEEPDCVSENFGSRKTLCLRGEYHDFVLEICCLTIPKNFVGEPFFVSQNLWYRKKLWIRRGGGVITVFSQNFFLTVPKNFVVEPFWSVFQKKSGSEKKIMDKRGGGVSRFSVENFLSHSAEKFHRGTLLCCFRKFLVGKKIFYG